MSDPEPDRPREPAADPSPDTSPEIRALAGAQSALAQRLDALERMVGRLRAGRGETARLDKLQEAVADLAAAHHDVHRRLDALAGAVEQLAADGLGEDPDNVPGAAPSAATFVPPVSFRGWRPRLKRWARAVLRSTVGKLRHVWDAAHPRPPWGDDVRLELEREPAREPSLTVVIPAGAAAAVVARLERQTSCAGVRLIRTEEADGATIGSDYVWDVEPGSGGWPPALIETARLLLATEALGFVCFAASDDAPDRWIVARELRHATGGLDSGALERLAKRQPGRVLGKIAGGGGSELLPRALCTARIRRRVRRSGSYVLAVATRPRTVSHRLAEPVAGSRPRAEAGCRSGVLVLLTAALAGGLERVVATLLEELGEENHPVLATTADHSSWSVRRWQALERFTPWLYPLGGIFAEPLHAAVLQELIARHHVRRLIHAGGGEAWPALAAALRRRCPDLEIEEPELRPVVDLEPAAVPAGSRERLRAELGCPPEAVLVAMCADLITEQRPEDYVALAHRLRDDDGFRFLLCGDGPLRAAVEDLARLLGPRGLVLEAPRRDLGAMLDAADVVCTTAEADPLPHAVLAALLRRRPVVAAAGELKRLLEVGPCGIAVPHPGDLDGFEAALRSLAGGVVRRELGERGPRAVRAFYGEAS